MSPSSPPASPTLTAFFDDPDAARRAVRRLREAGVAEDRVRLIEGSGSGSGGFPEGLGSFFSDDERDAHAGRLSRGGSLVVATDLPAERREEAERVLEAAGARDIGGRAEAQRAQGRAGRADAAAGDPAHAPRPVQPGFTDVRPGYVPDQLDTPVVDGGGEPGTAGASGEPQGRFTEQLDNLPGGEGRRSRVTIITPKES